MNKALDIFMIYQFLKRLTTPFTKWKAYELGIIDEKGNVLRKRIELQTKEEKKAWGHYDILVANLKKLLAKLPGGSSPVVSFNAALILLKEEEMDEKQIISEVTTTVSSGVADSAKAAPKILNKQPVTRKKSLKPFIKKIRKKKKKGVDITT